MKVVHRIKVAVFAIAPVALAALVSPQIADAGSYTIYASGNQVCALGTFIANAPGFSKTCKDGHVLIEGPAGGSAANDRVLWQIQSPDSALTMTEVALSEVKTNDMNNGSPGYGGGAYWQSAGHPMDTGLSYVPYDFTGLSTGYFGLQLVCTDRSGCDGTGSQSHPWIASDGALTITVEENRAPALIAVGSDNLFYQQNHWVWNPPGNPWPVPMYGSDPSGVCTMAVSVNGNATTNASSSDSSTWQQCKSGWTDDASVDTPSVIPGAGQLALVLSATNAARVQAAASATINVDNIQPTVTITPLNDTDPGGWSVNHSVTLRVAPAAGPSGLSGTSCTDTVDGRSSALNLTPDPSVPTDYDVMVDGNGSHAVSCTAANNAVDPSGAHNTGTSSLTVDIDEQPPSLSFEAVDPLAPNQVVVDTADTESPVASGSMQIAPVNSNNWRTLATSLTGNGELIGTIPDGVLHAGVYTIRATATSLVGNSAAASEEVTLPLRAPTISQVSFARIVDPRIAKRVRERVLVGWHWGARLNKHGKPIKVKVGGHYKTITVIRRVTRCATHRVKVGKNKWKQRTRCALPHVRYVSKTRVPFGRRVAVYGELLTGDGVPVSRRWVTVYTAPNNGSDRFRRVSRAETNAKGGWMVRLGSGPSRIVRAVFAGSGTLLPAASRVSIAVPARIKIWITPRRIPWSGIVTIHGRLIGGYVPRDGVAMRLLIKLPGRPRPYSPVPFRTTSKGSFAVQWSWGTGSGVVSYPFRVATTSSESDYPYAAAASRWVSVTFGT